MAKAPQELDYRAEYIWSPGDEDPASSRDFKAKNDKDALKQARTFGRRGDGWVVYRKVGSVSHR